MGANRKSEEMKKEACIGMAQSGDGTVWARATRSGGGGPSSSGTGAPPPPKPGEGLVLVVPTADALVRAFRIPSSDPDEIAAIAANQMESESPLDPAEMVFSHEVLHLGEGEALVLGAAVSAAACDRALELAGAEPGRVERVDVAAAGLSRALDAAGALAPSGRQPVLAQEGDRAVLLILDERRLVLARAVSAARAVTTASLASALRMAFLQVEMECGPESAAAPLLLCCDGEALRVAAESAAAAVGRACEAPPPAAIAPHAAAFGAALRSLSRPENGEPPLDLFPEPWRQALADRRYKRLFVGSVALAAVAWVALVAGLWGWPAVLRARENALQRVVESREEAEGAVRQVRERIRLIDRYSDRTHSPLEILREVSLALPDGVTLKSYTYEGARREASVEADARASAPAYDFSNRLKSSPLLARNDIVSGPTENRNTGKTSFKLRLSFSDGASNSGGAP